MGLSTMSSQSEYQQSRPRNAKSSQEAGVSLLPQCFLQKERLAASKNKLRLSMRMLQLRYRQHCDSRTGLSKQTLDTYGAPHIILQPHRPDPDTSTKTYYEYEASCDDALLPRSGPN